MLWLCGAFKWMTHFLSRECPCSSITRFGLSSMPYTEAVLREVWRFQPVVPGTGELKGSILRRVRHGINDVRGCPYS